MSTRIGLVSDVHSSPEALRHALKIFAEQKVDDIICAGDIAGYYDSVAPVVEQLIAADCKAIVGNHDQSYLKLPADEQEPSVRDYLAQLPQTLELVIESKKILVVHANPPSEQSGGIKLLDRHGELVDERKQEWSARLADCDADVLIVGHTHQVYAERLGRVFVVNPGSSAFNYSCMILSLPELDVETFALEGREIIKCWNFGLLFS